MASLLDNPYFKQAVQQRGMLAPQQPPQNIGQEFLQSNALRDLGLGLLQSGARGESLGEGISAGFTNAANAIDNFRKRQREESLQYSNYLLGLGSIENDLTQQEFSNNIANQEMGLRTQELGLRNQDLNLRKQQLGNANAYNNAMLANAEKELKLREVLNNAQAQKYLAEANQANVLGGLLGGNNMQPQAQPYADEGAQMSMMGQQPQPSNPLMNLSPLEKISIALNPSQGIQGILGKQEKIKEAEIPSLELLPNVQPNSTAINKAREVSSSYETLNKQLDKLNDLYSVEGRSLPMTSAAKQYDTIRTTILTQLKGLEQMGALDKGVQDVFEQMIGDPTGVSGITGTLPEQTQQFRSYLNEKTLPYLYNSGYKLKNVNSNWLGIPSDDLDLLRKNKQDPEIRKQFEEFYKINPDYLF